MIGRRMSRQEWGDHVAAQVEAAQEKLSSQLAELRSGDDWKQYLHFQAKLHHYSPNNATLISFQHAEAYAAGQVPTPEPSYVAGYGTWKTLGRTVDRGQHGYAILAPVRALSRVAIDPDGAARPLTPGELANPAETESVRRVVRGFKVEHVFDVSQTRGRPLPAPVRPTLLAGEAPYGLGETVLAFIENRGFHVDTASSAAELDGANGVTFWNLRRVLIRSDMDDAAMVKTLIHEAAHVLLHEKAPGQSFPRQLKEVEAESVAYIVSAVHGMTSDDYSFPYVATWAGDHLEGALRLTQTRVAAAAKTIIDCSPAPHHTGGNPLVEGIAQHLGGGAVREHSTALAVDR